MKDNKDFITLREALENPVFRAIAGLPGSRYIEPIRPMVIGGIPDYSWINSLYSERARGVRR